MRDQLEKGIKTAFGYCRAKGIDSLGFDDPPYQPLLNAAYKYYADYWSYEQFGRALDYYLNLFLPNPINNTIINQIIDEIEFRLKANVEDVFIVAPLKGGWIDTTFTNGYMSIIKTTAKNVGVIPAPLSIPSIVSKINSVTGIDKKRINHALSAITHSRAKDFLSCPLLILKRRGQYDEISSIENAHFLFRYYNMFLTVMALVNKIPKNNRHIAWINADHFFCFDNRDNYNHYPLRNVISLEFDFSFISKSNNPQLLDGCIKMFETKEYDSLQVLYLRAMMFYSNSIKGSEYSREDISFKLLNILIAAETLLVFTTRGEKKNKLASIIVGLLAIPEADKQRCTSSVIEAYSDRSGFVHSGNQNLSKYIKDAVPENEQSQSFNLVNELVGKVMIEFPKWYSEISAIVSKHKRVEQWKEKVKGYIPLRKYTRFQKICLWLIYSIRRLGKLGPDT